jgi:hypothetical protein
MDLPLLTDTEVTLLTRSGQGVCLTPDALVTRTALYERSPQSQLWHRLAHGLCLAHVKSEDGYGFRWQQSKDRFVRCACPQCVSTDTDDEP